LVPYFEVDGNCILDVYRQSLLAIDFARKNQAPAVVHYKNLVRRFGHAATDRQTAYLGVDEIELAEQSMVLEQSVAKLIELSTAKCKSISEKTTSAATPLTYDEVLSRLRFIEERTRASFQLAATEPKVDRQDMLDRVSAPLSPPTKSNSLVHHVPPPAKALKRDVMRKHMTRVIAEAMESDDSIVYIGEDVEHGGYYLVSDGLKSRFPRRVIDFPPDETSLLGAAMGMSQVGLTPIVEIPYAKYLACGADIWEEIAVMNWLSNGNLRNGMIVRLQGFDRGLFGGNFHTHNSLHLVNLPGVDVVCYSNGQDYVRGFRNLVRQAKAGRVVVSVDCTHLLNLRHVHDGDRAWECTYPPVEDGTILDFDQVRIYGSDMAANPTTRMAVITYGNGVVTVLRARQKMVDSGMLFESQLDVVDCPYLSRVPAGLKALLSRYPGGLVFADICKSGPSTNVLSSFITELQNDGLLPEHWSWAGAARTYNPLGSVVTFLNEDDIVTGVTSLQRQSK
jgi:pyruvate/2-oxoglutarate/acetoin dehydrogenase E1 component